MVLCNAPPPREGETYTSTGASDPSPIIEFAAQLRDEVRGVLGVIRLYEVVVVGGGRDGLVFGGGHGGLGRVWSALNVEHVGRAIGGWDEAIIGPVKTWRPNSTYYETPAASAKSVVVGDMQQRWCNGRDPI